MEAVYPTVDMENRLSGVVALLVCVSELATRVLASRVCLKLSSNVQQDKNDWIGVKRDNHLLRKMSSRDSSRFG